MLLYLWIINDMCGVFKIYSALRWSICECENSNRIHVEFDSLFLVQDQPCPLFSCGSYSERFCSIEQISNLFHCRPLANKAIVTKWIHQASWSMSSFSFSASIFHLCLRFRHTNIVLAHLMLVISQPEQYLIPGFMCWLKGLWNSLLVFVCCATSMLSFRSRLRVCFSVC